MGILDKLKAGLRNLTKNEPQFDPTTLKDEVALKTGWGPKKGGGTNVCTHGLIKISPGRMEFKASRMAWIFPGIFMVAGIGVFIGMTLAGLKEDITMLYFGIPFGSVFFLAGFFIFRSWTTPRVFDLNKGYYWKGRKTPEIVNQRGKKDVC